ncbi:hypothetical protein NM688_g1860 [Phlebia brevispora]|uniref:Uncharacterized protein n=1 Tax=Phlebia brevispora TaxID=194682 RepID=A0ACC1TA49_9APHY|nr:hypothetical protein NM688_g1860 [Phlebia brevispora]
MDASDLHSNSPDLELLPELQSVSSSDSSANECDLQTVSDNSDYQSELCTSSACSSRAQLPIAEMDVTAEDMYQQHQISHCHSDGMLKGEFVDDNSGSDDSAGYGGGAKHTILIEELAAHPLYAGTLQGLAADSHVSLSAVVSEPDVHLPISQYKVICEIPLEVLIKISSRHHLCKIYELHETDYSGPRQTIAVLQHGLREHVCSPRCQRTLAEFDQPVFQSTIGKQSRWRVAIQTPAVAGHPREQNLPSIERSYERSTFPPEPHDRWDLAGFVHKWVDATAPEVVVQIPCGVCGRAMFPHETTKLRLNDPAFEIVYSYCERATDNHISRDRTQEILCACAIHNDGDTTRVTVCGTCFNSLKKDKKLPRLALANEKMVVARYRHNVCTAEIRIGGVRRRMKANAVIFVQPVAKLQRVLPPPREELDECLVILFTGATDPTKQDFERTPFLENHRDYADVQLSPENLKTYPENTPPVAVLHRVEDGLEPMQNRPVFDTENEKGTEQGPCEFAIHGMSVEEYTDMSYNDLRLKAAEHLRLGKGFLAYGSSDELEFMFHNPRLYPGLFPWLFPYGLGGFENQLQSRAVPMRTHIKYLLSLYDRRFQVDEYFPFLVFNQEQIRQCSHGAYTLVHRGNFRNVTEKILNIEVDTLASLIERTKISSYVQAENEGEKKCLELLHLMDVVAGRVPISNTQKKYQWNEIRGLIYEKGLPFWFITFSPAEHNSLTALMMCGLMSQEDAIQLKIPHREDQLRAIAANPVACAKFFHFLVHTFLSVIVRAGHEEAGIFGKTSAYYGTVEVQGRLMLHLHLLLWTANSATPSEIRRRLTENLGSFQEKLVAWLESCHQGQFSTGSMHEVQARAVTARSMPEINLEETTEWEGNEITDSKNPLLHLLKAPRSDATADDVDDWYHALLLETDDIALQCNKHMHKRDPCLDSCRKGMLKQCRVRFLRPIIPETFVEKETDALFLKKLEPWINFYAPIVTYLLRCNTDVTCLLSGTQAKAVVTYVTDYMIKSTLKTHTIFEAVRNVLECKADVIAQSPCPADAAKKLICKMVNALTARTEIDHLFKVFPWLSYVQKRNHTGALIGLSKISDYTCRPRELEHISLYDYLRFTEVRKLTPDIWKQMHQARRELFLNYEQECDENDSGSESDEHESTTHLDAKQPLQFISDHPLHDTHVVFLLKCTRSLVLNFVGGTLPRRDKGDHEEYCRTMMTIFALTGWRSSLELKGRDQSWEDAFASTSFTKHSLQVMANMNLMYECLDARDDFAAQRKAEERSQWLAQQLGAELVESLQLDSNSTSANFTADEEEILHLLEQSSEIIGRETDLYQVYTPAIPSLSPSQWREVLQRARAIALDERCNEHTTNPIGGRTCHTASSADNEVTVMRADQISQFVKRFTQPYRANSPFELPSQYNHIIARFSLNEEQQRAFLQIAFHMSGVHNRPLRMYLGGMGGTGKSQVIKAVTDFLCERGEGARLELCTPTGAAASIIGGSTYHSMLGFNRDEQARSVTKLAKVCTRLAHVDLIFLDEVSMLSCLAMYRISEQLSNAFDTPLDPFGSKNVVLSGDFGQLPPPGAGQASLYSSTVSGRSAALTLNGQKKALGKALWHMFDTHVILRENMWQTGASPEDIAYWTLLTNARVKACNSDDFRLLDAITISIGQHATILATLPFSTSSDATARVRTLSADLPDNLRKLLWELPPSATEHVPGKISLCRGLPVMLKSNEATKLCVTNGAEATVYDWDAHMLEDSREVLDTIFLQLKDPPREISIADLPLNVVPVPVTTERIHCLLPNDTSIWITWRQAPILPNFAMTDFASQGWTRPVNPVDIRHSGTIILALFDKQKLTGELSKDLKREMRELEIMDHINKLRFHGTLPAAITGSTRAELVQNYQKTFGLYYMPPNTHPA